MGPKQPGNVYDERQNRIMKINCCCFIAKSHWRIGVMNRLNPGTSADDKSQDNGSRRPRRTLRTVYVGVYTHIRLCGLMFEYEIGDGRWLLNCAPGNNGRGFLLLFRRKNKIEKKNAWNNIGSGIDKTIFCNIIHVYLTLTIWIFWMNNKPPLLEHSIRYYFDFIIEKRVQWICFCAGCIKIGQERAALLKKNK